MTKCTVSNDPHLRQNTPLFMICLSRKVDHRTICSPFSHTHLLSNFWTSRGHRCRPFSPPVLAFNFYRAQGSAILLLVDFLSSVANWRSRAFRNFFTHIYFPASGRAVVTSVVPSRPRFLPSILSAWGSAIPLLVDFSSSVANSRCRAFRESTCAQEKSPRIHTSMHSGGFELTKLTYTRLEENLICHRGDRHT